MIAVVDSGSGNLRSVERALAHAGGAPVLTRDPDVVRRADRVVVPGQGAFADCMATMQSSGLGEAIREVIRAGKPYLGICLGLQILFEDSEEHGPVAGLGILGGHVVRFPAGPLKVPHIGWNQVQGAGEEAHRHRPARGPDQQCPPRDVASGSGGDRSWGEALLAGIPRDAHFYFIHSYVAVPTEGRHVALNCDYGGPFCAAVRVDNLFACQFHPEKSQAVGLRLLGNFARGPV